MRWDRHPWVVYMLATLFWAGLILASLTYTLALYDRQAEQVALTRARVLFDFIETARLWNARHGGLYAEVNDLTQPNPYLRDPARDVLINGKLFTKVNPAFMTRQLAELMQAEHPVWFNMTSLDPLRPDNGPDAWEEKALHRFEDGAAEVLEPVETSDGTVYRYMHPLMVTKPCLPCHIQQGYKIGDVRGGISVTIPQSFIAEDLAPQRRQAIALHAGAFVLLAGLTLLFLRHAQGAWGALALAKRQQEDLVARRTAELSDANEALQRSNEDLETFAYVASHDLREPLRMVTSYGSLLRRRAGDRLDDEGREFLHYMTDGASRMQAMIDDLLAYSRVERAELRLQPATLGEVVGLVRHDLGMAIAESGAALSVVGGETCLCGDPALLHRLLLNLIGNAVRHGRTGAEPVRVTVAAWMEGETTIVEVADTGPGIPADSHDRVFQMFQRLTPRAAPSDDGKAAGGTGMGLAICRRIVERHGGHIWVEDDAPGTGARFRFSLPCLTDTASGDAPQPAPASA